MPAPRRRSNCRPDSHSGRQPVVGNIDPGLAVVAAAVHLNWNSEHQVAARQARPVAQGLHRRVTVKWLQSRQLFELEAFLFPF
jgi:hypothetical protein